jgi:hypothetical protein
MTNITVAKSDYVGVVARPCFTGLGHEVSPMRKPKNA